MKRLALLLVLVSVPAMAEPSPQQRLTATQQQLEATQARTAELKAQAAALDTELKGLRERLISATTDATRSAKELDELESNLADLEGTAARRNVQLAAQRQELSETLALLQRLALMPPAAQLLSPTPPLDRLRTDMQLKALLPEIEKRSAELAGTVADLRLLQSRLTDKRRRALAEQRRLTAQQAEINKLMAERTRKLASTRSLNSREQLRADRLAGQAQSLRELMDRLEAEQRAQQQAEPGESPARVLSALPSGAARRLPVAGPALLRFGERDEFGTVSKGITLRPRPGIPVAAVASGRVAFAGPFRGYGRVLILEHSGGYHTILAGLGQVNVSVGQTVAAGEPLGTISTQQDPPPELYFEVRREGVPVDPLGAAATRLTQSRSP